MLGKLTLPGGPLGVVPQNRLPPGTRDKPVAWLRALFRPREVVVECKPVITLGSGRLEHIDGPLCRDCWEPIERCRCQPGDEA